MNNLIAMSKRDMEEEFQVKIRVNFDSTSAAMMEDFLCEISPLFKDDPRFNVSFHPVGRWGGPHDSVLNVCDANSSREVRLTLMGEALHSGFSDQPIRASLGPHGNVCYAAKENSIVVGSDGTVYKCTVVFDDPRNKVGRMTRDGDMIVNQEYWDLWTKMAGKNTGKCGSCTFHPSCQSRSCPLVAMEQKEPPCPMTISERESLVKLAVSASMATTH